MMTKHFYFFNPVVHRRQPDVSLEAASDLERGRFGLGLQEHLRQKDPHWRSNSRCRRSSKMKSFVLSCIINLYHASCIAVVLKPGVVTHLCVADFLQGVAKTS
jgi:hypothetical protein